MREFWTRMAPYIPLIEVGHVNPEVIADLVQKGLVRSPVLVVGAGHGLLVDELRRHGHAVEGVDYLPDAIEGARARRGIELELAEADALPYADGRFATVIIASGVVDFLDDRAAIGGIVAEAVRVTKAGGRTLVGFWSLEEGASRFFEAIGMVDRGRFRQRDAFAMTRQSPVVLLRWIVGQVGFLRAAWILLWRFAFLPPQERHQAAALDTIWRTEADPEGLLAAVPNDVPLYGLDQIASLLANFHPSCHAYRTCNVAELAK